MNWRTHLLCLLAAVFTALAGPNALWTEERLPADYS